MPRTKTPALSRLKEYFTFTKWQRRAVILSLVIIAAIAVLEAGWPYWFAQKSMPADSIVLEQVNELVTLKENADSLFAANSTNENWRVPKAPKQEPVFSATRLFHFDPNTASAEELTRLGLRSKTVETLLKYRSKGGRFRKPEDILKIYSLPKEQAIALLPYVRIADAPANIASAGNTLPPLPKTEKPYTTRTVNINESDTTAWIALPGIGSKLANRIINFRDKLGGFYSIAQVGETYALPDSTFQKIKSRLVISQAPVLRTINLNTVSADQFRAHPYVKWNLANAIVNYRSQHGPFQSIEDLKKIMLVEEQWLNKMRPYLTLE